jgi:hypothetical protein
MFDIHLAILVTVFFIRVDPLAQRVDPTPNVKNPARRKLCGVLTLAE